MTGFRYTFIYSLALTIFSICTLSACGGSSNKAPNISGTPQTSIALGNNYSFLPLASDPNEDKLSYKIQNKPSWATFDVATGALSGMPNAAGQYKNIIISVSDGKLEQSLTPFDISVTSEASSSDINFISSSAGVTPFISFLQLKGSSLAKVKSIRFTISAKMGSTAKEVQVTHSIDELNTRNYVDLANNVINLPVFGLYSGYDNTVSLQITFNDTSAQTISAVVPTAAYIDPAQIYDRPTFIKRRESGSLLGFDFFAIKTRKGAPIVIDTDGEIRWVGAGNIASLSSIYSDNGFLVGTTNASSFQRLELDGTVTNGAITPANYGHFHHNIDMGKVGFLGHFDTDSDIESLVGEFTMAGNITKDWNFAHILRDYMTSQGDDPSTFIRPGIDWFHSNAATYDARDNSVIVSSRENFLIKVNYDTGNIIWIFGDPTKYWYTFPSLRAKAITLESGGLYPIGQHATSITSDGLLMLFNDGQGSLNQPANTPAGETRSYSAVSAYQIDGNALTAKEVWRFDYNQSIFSGVCSSAYEADDKSLLVNYAVADHQTKARLVGLNKNHDVIFDFEYPTTGCATSWNAVPVNFEKMQF